MSAHSQDVLLGRLAVHYKMLTMDQLNELTQAQARAGGTKRLGQLMIEGRYISSGQLEQLLKVQRDYLEKQKARASEGQRAQAGAAAQEVVSAAQKKSRVGAIQVGKAKVDRTTGARVVDLEVGRPVPTADTAPASTSVPSPAPAPSRAPTPVATAAPSPSLSTAPPASGPKRVDAVLRDAVAAGASDVHFHANSVIRRRVNGTLADVGGERLSGDVTEAMTLELLSDYERHALQEKGQIDFAYAIDGVARFRCNAYRQQTGTDLVMRAISADPPSLEQLGLPTELARFTNYHQGMVLLTGPAGSGKSSTMAALINIINEERLDHIITVEDPIEFVHVNKRCVVNQRQVGPHTKSFARALKGALREDPDIIALGELRDLETISLALTAAETGHLVLATLHTGNAIRTVNRLIGVFPPNQQAQIRTMVSESLRAVVSQRLIPRADGQGRVPALEILVTTKAVGNTIRDNKTFQLRSALQTGAAHGMKMLDNSLAELVRNGTVKREDAVKQADDPQKFPS